MATATKTALERAKAKTTCDICGDRLTATERERNIEAATPMPNGGDGNGACWCRPCAIAIAAGDQP